MTQTNASADAAIQRLPAALHRPVRWLMASWPGRVGLRSVAGMGRIEVFDRSMTIAAQFFTSVFPILIMLAVWVGASSAEQVAEAVEMPPQTKQMLTDVLNSEAGFSSFGVLGALVVLVSATSLSRALARAFDAVWELPKARRRLLDTWRLVAAVVVLALSMVLTRLLVRWTEGLPPRDTWSTLLNAAVYGVIALFVPWLLMTGRIRARLLLPGAVVFALVMVIAQPLSRIYLPHALATSAHRYGSIGVAFTYIAWLYVMSFILLGAAVIGRAVALDEGWLGRKIVNTSGDRGDHRST